MSKLRVVAAIAVGGLVTAMVPTSLQAAQPQHPAKYSAKHPASARSHAYDGLWSVSILTQAGPCNASYRYPARIVGGQVKQADNDFSYRISGAVVASGAILVTVTQGGQRAMGYGQLRGGSGGGRWSAGGNQCYGTWSAMRRAAY